MSPFPDLISRLLQIGTLGENAVDVREDDCVAAWIDFLFILAQRRKKTWRYRQ